MLITCVKSNDTTNTVEELKLTGILQPYLNCKIAPPGFLVPKIMLMGIINIAQKRVQHRFSEFHGLYVVFTSIQKYAKIFVSNFIYPILVNFIMFQTDFTTDFYFRQFWTDVRIAFNHTQGNIKTLTIAAEMAKKLWVPDTFFANEKSAYFHTATTENTFLRISRDGQVLRSIRLTVTANCPMQLHYFPMDRQMCSIEIESSQGLLKIVKIQFKNSRIPKNNIVGYTTADITYYWHDGKKSVLIDKTQLPQFQVLGHRQLVKHFKTTTGNYSRLSLQIQFVRSMGYYLIQIYIPSGLIVIISWVSFWLNRNATPARVSLGVTTVLTMTTLMSSTNAALPKISYVKSIDIYLGTCFVMVFASLLEYATVGYLGKRMSMRKSRNQALQRLAEQRRAPEPCQMGMGIQSSSSNQDHHNSHSGLHMKTTEVRFKNRKGYENTVNGTPDLEGQIIRDFSKMYGISPSDIDKYSRVVFPVCFICFNLMYWIIYMHISDVLAEDLVHLDN
ncbi:Gamma-aminobutyric acid receptor subunit beta [Nymphon striatum]|nr:Gamma-aminobutyric acid receptor subunit beta [Nymphon striatum]